MLTTWREGEPDWFVLVSQPHPPSSERLLSPPPLQEGRGCGAGASFVLRSNRSSAPPLLSAWLPLPSHIDFTSMI